MLKVQVDVVFYNLTRQFVPRLLSPPVPACRPRRILRDVVVEELEDLDTQIVIGHFWIVRHSVLKVLVNLFSDVFET